MKSLYKLKLLTGVAAMMFMLTGNLSKAQTVYIADGSSGAGTSWADAAGSIQDAIESASEGTNIWIKAGTYYVPGDSMFVLKRGVSLYGGFSGTETDISQRIDYRMGGLNETILSADIDKNGVNDAGNATRVMYGDSISSTSTLDGLTIRDGYADGAGDDGGGLRLNKGNMNIVNCSFAYNYCNDNGAGLYLYNAATPSITGCYFTANFADDKGGAAYTATGCDAEFTNCVFENNSADTDAGALRIYVSSPTVVNCTFTRNALGSGDGSAVEANNIASSPTFINCVFWGNLEADTLSEDLSLTTDATGTITNCAFQGTFSATGATATGTVDISITDPLFSNTAGTAGYLGYDAAADWSLQSGSPLVSKGTASGAPAKDINGITRGTPPTIGAFAPSLIITTNITGSGIISPFRAYLVSGSNQDFKIIPAPGYEIGTATYDGNDIISSLTDNGDGSFGYTAASVSANGLLAVTFNPLSVKYTVTVTAGANGSVDPLGDTMVTVTDEVVFTITPASGYLIDSLNLNGNSVINSLVDNQDGTYSYTLTGVGENSSLEVSFIKFYTVTATAGDNGSIDPAGETIVTANSETEFIIIPSPGYDVATFTLNSNDVSAELVSNADGSFSYTLSGVNADAAIAVTFSELVGTIVYIKPGGTGDGSSWANAAGDIQATIDAAEPGDQIWIAGGTYLVTLENSFMLKNNVSLYGGFAGTESSINSRKNFRMGEPNETKLSGDLDGNGFLTGGNAPRVVFGEYISSATTIDGFTITGGFSDEDGSNGAGMKLRASSPHVVNCTFFDNYCDDGPALYLYRDGDNVSSPTIENCFFIKGFANDDGGAIYNASGTRARFINCVFAFNQANDEGGAIRNFECSPEFYNCTFVYNSLPSDVDPGGGGTYGPAIRNYQSSSSAYMNTEPKFVNCVFWRNQDGTSEINYDISNTGNMTAANANAILMNCAFGGITSSSCIATDTFQIAPFDNPGFVDVSGSPGYVGYNASAYWDLVAGSPLIATGNNTEEGVPIFDIEGEKRGGVVDIGAYEFGVTTSIGQIYAKELYVTLFPNPSDGSFTLMVRDGNITAVEVFDLTGRLIAKFGDPGNRNIIPIRLDADSKGLYLLKIRDSYGRESTQKIIIK